MRNALNHTGSLIYSSLQYQAASSSHVSLRFVFIQVYLALYFLGAHIAFIRPTLFCPPTERPNFEPIFKKKVQFLLYNILIPFLWEKQIL